MWKPDNKNSVPLNETKKAFHRKYSEFGSDGEFQSCPNLTETERNRENKREKELKETTEPNRT